MSQDKTISEARIYSLLTDIKNTLDGKEKEDKWMGVHQAAEYCCVSAATLRRNVEKKQLSASNTTGKLLFKRSELEKWLTHEEKHIKMTHAVGGFGRNPGNLKKAQDARRKLLGRKPRTAKEHEEWRKKQKQKFKLW